MSTAQVLTAYTETFPLPFPGSINESVNSNPQHFTQGTSPSLNATLTPPPSDARMSVPVEVDSQQEIVSIRETSDGYSRGSGSEHSVGESASTTLSPKNEVQITSNKPSEDTNNSQLESYTESAISLSTPTVNEQIETIQRPQLTVPILSLPCETIESSVDQLPYPETSGPPKPLEALVPELSQSQKVSIPVGAVHVEASSPTSLLPIPFPSPETDKPPTSPGSSILPFPGETNEAKQDQDLFKPLDINLDFSSPLAPPKLLDDRRHSSIELKPETEGGLLMPTQFPEMKRYSLVDVSPLSELGADNKSTLSDQNKDAFSPLTWSRDRKLSSVDGTQSSSSSRSASLAPPEQRNRRYSTFAEMGIQSYAMTKGEKTVSALDVQVKRERRKSKLNFSLSSLNLSTASIPKEGEKTNGVGETEAENTASQAEEKPDSPKVEPVKKKESASSNDAKLVKKKASKQRDCIIM